MKPGGTPSGFPGKRSPHTQFHPVVDCPQGALRIARMIFHDVNEDLASMCSTGFNQVSGNLPALRLGAQEIDCAGDRALRIIPCNPTSLASSQTEQEREPYRDSKAKREGTAGEAANRRGQLAKVFREDVLTKRQQGGTPIT